MMCRCRAKLPTITFACDRCGHEWVVVATGGMGARHWCPVCYLGKGTYNRKEAKGGRDL